MKKARTHTFVCGSLEEIAGQLLRAPAEHRVQHVRRAEKLHDEMLGDPDGSYPLAYILFRITGLKAMYATEETLFARGITHDLREIIDQLSKDLDLMADPTEGCLDTQELSKQKKVATRTIARWREDGLRWRWGRLKPRGYLQVLFPAAAVAAFEAANADKVAYAAAFSQLSAQELRRLFQRAQRLAEATGAQPFTVARHIARRTGRSTEALRIVLLRHDQAEAPENRIFRDYTEALTQEQKNDLFRSWLARVPTRELTRQFKRTRATIYRVVNEKRVEDAAKTLRPWHDLPTLSRPDAKTVFLSASLESFMPGDQGDGPADLPEAWRPFFTCLPPTDENMARLFLRLNYLNYCAHHQCGQLREAPLRVCEVENLEAVCREAQTCRSAVARAALPVVLSLAHRHLANTPESMRSPALVRLVSLSVPLLDESIDLFDPAGKIPFPRFLSNRLLQHYAHLKADHDRAKLSGDDLVAQTRSRLETLAATPK